MNLPLYVRSNYYKGLLVVSRRDRVIDARERSLLIQIGEILDFDRRFCESAIDGLLSNAHISRTPVVFHEDAIKECFFRDAMRLARTDGCIHPRELSWLRKAARANGRSGQWLDAIILKFLEQEADSDHCTPFEIQKHIQGIPDRPGISRKTLPCEA
jgi:hypothetical protein